MVSKVPKRRVRVVRSKKKPVRRTSVVRTQMLSQGAKAWLNLLRDPCAAPLSSPCYSGSDGGYLIRTTDILPSVTVSVPTGTIGTISKVNLCIEYTPYNASSITGIVNGNDAGINVLGINNFITNNVLSGNIRFRPISGCMKWLPSGAYGTRAGLVGLMYSPGQTFTSTANTPTLSPNLLAGCQRVASNGSEPHEVRWLPTIIDEKFTSILAPSDISAGTVLIVLQGVDCTYVSTTTATPNGVFELTTGWEWIPASASGIAVPLKAPQSNTTQQVLSQIGDVASFVFQGALRGTVGAASRLGSAYATEYLTRGVRSSTTRALAY